LRLNYQFLLTSFIFTAIALIDPNLSLAQIKTEKVPKPQTAKIIDTIQVRFVDKKNQPIKGKTKPEVIIRELQFQPGDSYSPELAEEGISGVKDLAIVKRASLSLETIPRSNRSKLIVTVEEKNNFFVSFAGTLPAPTALQGPSRPVTVIPLSNDVNGTSVGARLGWLNLGGRNQAISFGAQGGTDNLGLDIGYRHWMRHDTGYGFNFFNRQGIEPEFDKGDTEVDLPQGADPKITRLGGGGEFFFPITQNFTGAAGISYQLISARDGIFSPKLQPRDELGNRLTIDDDGQDTLLTLNFAGVLDKRDRSIDPTQGYRLLVGSDQSLPIGDANIFYNRLSLQYASYIPCNLFGFSEGDRTLVLAFQGGTTIGDLPPYEAFSLGGSKTVRGFGGGELGTGRSFIVTTAEYRFPIVAVRAFKQDFPIKGTLFIDYSSDLGSGDTVPGIPAISRDKPGDGVGYGFGFRSVTPIGVARIEFAWTNQDENAIYFTIGDR
jgi:outer membrane protein insertion porin family